MRIMKRTLGIVLAILMAFSMMPLTVFASVPVATVTAAEAPEGAAFAYKFEAPANGDASYDSYKADFVATFDRDIKAGEVTLYGKYGGYDWTPVVINRDIAAGEEFLIVKEFLNDTMSYATIRDEVSPFYCGAGGAVLANTNMSVQLKLFDGAPAAGEGIAASEVVTDDIAEELPKAIVNNVVGAPAGIHAYSFTAPHSAAEVDNSAYKDYRCDFVVTFDKDIAEGDVILCGSYGEYGWVDMPAQAYTANTEYRLLSTLGDTLTYATVCKEVSPFLCGYKGAAAEETGMKVEFRFYDVSTGVEVPAGTSAEVETTVPVADDAVPTATVTAAEAPEGAAFAYKFEAPADKPTAYDNYKADFVATFDRDIKAGEVTLYGKYGEYGWTPVVIDRDIAAGEEFLIVKEFLNDTMSYETIRDEISPFYCGAGGAVLADTNMSVQLKLFNGTPAAGEGIAASEVVTDDIAEPLPQAIVNNVVGAPAGIHAYSFTAPHSAAEVDNSAYKDYRCDFVVTFEKDVAEGDVTLWGNYGEYGWVDMPAQAFTAGTEYRILKDVYGDTLTYATICKEVSPFLCGFSGAAAEETGMKVELRFYKVENGVEVPAGVAGEVETTVPEKEAVAEDKYNIVITDSIHLNVYIDAANVTKIAYKYDLDPAVQENTTPSTAVEKNVSELTEQNGYYKIEIPLAPAQIRDSIVIDVFGANGKLRTIDTSIAKYCEDLIKAIDRGDQIEGMTSDEIAVLRDLAVATLDYGKAASEYFGYNTAAFANYEIQNSNPIAPDGVLEASDTSGIIGDGCGVRYIATSVPELRFETNLDKDAFFDEEGNALYTVTCTEGYDVKFATINNSTVVIQVKGIPASKLCDTLHLNISGNANGTISYTPIIWANGAAMSNNYAKSKLGVSIIYYSEAVRRTMDLN